MDVTVTVRHCEIPDRFRRHLAEKVEKVEQLSPRSRRVAAVISYEANPRLVSVAYCIELTILGSGPVVRAEASAEDPYAALDLAFGKVAERLRRAQDRRRVHHGRHTPESLTMASARWEDVDGPAARATAVMDRADGESRTGDDGVPAWAMDGMPEATSPITVREKTHAAVPMSLDQAMYEMELVGHDFFLYIDADCGAPSVVYRRKGWSYGVIRLQPEQTAHSGQPADADPAGRPQYAVSD